MHSYWLFFLWHGINTIYYYIKVSGIASGNKLINIGTQSVQELFFCDSIRRTVYSNDLVKFFGCNIQQERNWEFMMYIPCYIGNGKIAK